MSKRTKKQAHIDGEKVKGMTNQTREGRGNHHRVQDKMKEGNGNEPGLRKMKKQSRRRRNFLKIERREERRAEIERSVRQEREEGREDREIAQKGIRRKAQLNFPHIRYADDTLTILRFLWTTKRINLSASGGVCGVKFIPGTSPNVQSVVTRIKSHKVGKGFADKIYSMHIIFGSAQTLGS